jgi:uncharacterized membrane protein (UPF0136 family)
VVAVKASATSWTIALFFGCALVFAGLRKLTQGEPAGVTLAVQVGALLLIVAALVLFVRRRDAGGDD